MTPEEIKMLIMGLIMGFFAGQMSVIMLAAFMSANKRNEGRAEDEKAE